MAVPIAPEIDGNLFIDAGAEGLSVGETVAVEVDEAGEYITQGQRWSCFFDQNAAQLRWIRVVLLRKRCEARTFPFPDTLILRAL